MQREAGSRKQKKPVHQHRIHTIIAFQAFVGSDVEVHPERGNEGECYRIRLIVANSGEPIAAPSEFPGIL